MWDIIVPLFSWMRLNYRCFPIMITQINIFIFQSLMPFYSDFTFHIFLRLVTKLRRLCLDLILSSEYLPIGINFYVFYVLNMSKKISRCSSISPLYHRIFLEIKYLRIFKIIREKFKYKISLGLNYTACFYLSALYPNRNMSGTQWK